MVGFGWTLFCTLSRQGTRRIRAEFLTPSLRRPDRPRVKGTPSGIRICLLALRSDLAPVSTLLPHNPQIPWDLPGWRLPEDYLLLLRSADFSLALLLLGFLSLLPERVSELILLKTAFSLIWPLLRPPLSPPALLQRDVLDLKKTSSMSLGPWFFFVFFDPSLCIHREQERAVCHGSSTPAAPPPCFPI